jgi:phosphatidylglycerophosphate synthase
MYSATLVLSPRRRLQRSARSNLMVAAIVLSGVAAALAHGAGLGASYLYTVMLVFAAGGSLMLLNIGSHLPHEYFGSANRVTLGRFALTCLLAAMIGAPPALNTVVTSGCIAVVATVAVLLDGVDGWLARSSGTASAFGARLDMETDALLVLVLSVLVWQFERAGVWVIASGLMRYAFVAACRIWRWLQRPLPTSLRRKAVCVLQIVSLITCIAPIVPVHWATACAALGLALLVYSFSADIVALARQHDES